MLKNTQTYDIYIYTCNKLKNARMPTPLKLYLLLKYTSLFIFAPLALYPNLERAHLQNSELGHGNRGNPSLSSALVMPWPEL